MRRILIFIIGTIFLSGCIVSKTFYLIKSANIEHGGNSIYLMGKNSKISNVLLGFNFPVSMRKSKGDVLRLHSAKIDFTNGIKGLDYSDKKYRYLEVLNDVFIYKSNGEKIKIAKESIVYNYKKFSDTESPFAYIYTNQKFTGPVTLELGKVKINDEIYDIPPLHLQRYKESASWGLVDDFLMQGNVRNKPLYESGKWLDD
ncbi:hypothetical protein [Fusobacterium massiliense]|uniref:hypothetical protein n=1 Tax=Fusobacterium massiliense TaxID=1852365 RepID=UPI0028EE7CF9|nr:hypothetical protein [Fusobacterium massiliense]